MEHKTANIIPFKQGIQYTRYAVCIPFIGQVVPGYHGLTCLQSTQCNRKMYNKYDKINVQYSYLNLLTSRGKLVYIGLSWNLPHVNVPCSSLSNICLYFPYKGHIGLLQTRFI